MNTLVSNLERFLGKYNFAVIKASAVDPMSTNTVVCSLCGAELRWSPFAEIDHTTIFRMAVEHNQHEHQGIAPTSPPPLSATSPVAVKAPDDSNDLPTDSSVGAGLYPCECGVYEDDESHQFMHKLYQRSKEKK